MRLDRVIAVRNDKTVYRDGDRCVKVFYCPHTKAEVLNEALNQSQIEETCLKVPKVLEVSKFNNKWAMITEYIKGNTLERLMEMNPERLDEYMELFTELQLMIHELTCPVLRKFKDIINQNISRSELDATTRFDLHTKLEAMPVNDVVCHGDFNPSNVIISDNGENYVIDWSHAAQGNASADAAVTYLYFCCAGNESAGEKYLEIFEKKSGISQSDIRKWIPIMSASLSVEANKATREYLLTRINSIN